MAPTVCFSLRSPQFFSNFIDVLQTFKYYDPARILNRNFYYEYKIRIKKLYTNNNNKYNDFRTLLKKK